MTTKYNEVKVSPKKVEKDATHAETQTRKKKVITGEIVERKKGIFERLAITMVGPEGLPGIARYLGKEVLLPAVKDMTFNAFQSGLSMLLYGGERRNSSNAGRPTYNNQWAHPTQRTSTTTRTNYQQTSKQAPVEARGGVLEFVIPNRADASAVLNQLRDDIDRFGRASIADYYDYIGVDDKYSAYTDHTHGWSDLHTATILPVRDGSGYIIEFPPVEIL